MSIARQPLTDFICHQCRCEARIAHRVHNPTASASLSQRPPHPRTFVSPGATTQERWHAGWHTRAYSYSSRGRYRPPGSVVEKHFEDLLTQTPAQPPLNSQPPPDSEQSETLQKARVIFGTRLAGPVDRRRHLDAHSTSIAGVLVPPRPDEPDNCCMSGCVNCVWDRYREELEEWAERRGEADVRLASGGGGGGGGIGGGSTSRSGMGRPSTGERQNISPATSMDDDGGGRDTNWDLGPSTKPKPASPSADGADEEQDLFADIPVGIREFMRQEKRLKERKRERVANTS